MSFRAALSSGSIASVALRGCDSDHGAAELVEVGHAAADAGDAPAAQGALARPRSVVRAMHRQRRSAFLAQEAHPRLVVSRSQWPSFVDACVFVMELLNIALPPGSDRSRMAIVVSLDYPFDHVRPASVPGFGPRAHRVGPSTRVNPSVESPRNCGGGQNENAG